MYRVGAVVAVTGIVLGLVGVMTSIGWMILAGVAVLVASVVVGALAQRSTARTR